MLQVEGEECAFSVPGAGAPVSGLPWPWKAGLKSRLFYLESQSGPALALKRKPDELSALSSPVPLRHAASFGLVCVAGPAK